MGEVVTARRDGIAAGRESGVRVEPEPVVKDLREVDRGCLRTETLLVLALSLGASGVSALISFIGSLTKPGGLKDQAATLNGSYAPGRPGWTWPGSCSGSRVRSSPSCSSRTC